MIALATALRTHFTEMLCAIAFASGFGSSAMSADLGPPPATRRVEAADTRYGVTVADPYRWLEASDSAEVRNWIQLQNAYAEKYFADRSVSGLQQRISDLASAPSSRSVPKVAHGRIFFLQRQVSVQRASLLTMSFSGGEPGVIAAPGKDDSAIVNFWPSPGGRYIAVAKAASGRERLSIDVYDLTVKRIYESIPESAKVSTATLAWDADANGFYYIRSPSKAENGSARLDAAVYHHALGKGVKSDVLSFSRAISPLVELRPATAEFELVAGAEGQVALFSSIGDNPFNAVHLRNGNTWRRIFDESASINAGVWVKDRLLVLATGA
jgi:prolyl oligopeptidase